MENPDNQLGRIAVTKILGTTTIVLHRDTMKNFASQVCEVYHFKKHTYLVGIVFFFLVVCYKLISVRFGCGISKMVCSKVLAKNKPRRALEWSTH